MEFQYSRWELDFRLVVEGAVVPLGLLALPDLSDLPDLPDLSDLSDLSDQKTTRGTCVS